MPTHPFENMLCQSICIAQNLPQPRRTNKAAHPYKSIQGGTGATKYLEMLLVVVGGAGHGGGGGGGGGSGVAFICVRINRTMERKQTKTTRKRSIYRVRVITDTGITDTLA